MIQIRPVLRTKRDLSRFVRMAWPLYTGNDHWVPPLISEEISLLSPGKNPFWEHAERELFVAEREGRIVGRIAAVICHNHNKVYNEKTGFFGFYEAIDDTEVSSALFDVAEQWLVRRGMKKMRGPFNPNINETIGFLVKGFDQDPFIMMPYTLPYYPRHATKAGLKKIMDVYSYWADTDAGEPQKVARIASLVKKRYNITVRPINMKKLDEEAALIKQVHDEAWSANWGAVPFTDTEFANIVNHLKTIAIPELVPIVELEGKVVAIGVAVPDVNQIIGLANGRMFPFGFIKVLANQNKVNRVRVLILGVMSAYRKHGFDALLYHEIYKAAQKHGFKGGEFSWILENNIKMRRIIEGWGGKITKIYRVYEKPIKKQDKSRWDWLF